MRKNKLLTSGLLLVVSATGSAFAQQPTPATGDQPGVVTLSPFEVNTSADEGYTSFTTLAGTRLRADVRELGASITLITDQMMNDLAAQNLEELLPYFAGTEVGGLFGNMSGAGNVNFFGQGTPTTFLRQHAQSQTRLRGLSAADLTRNYFLTNVPVDGFNLDRVDIQRGANAILFGLGSPSGLINYQLIAPRFQDGAKLEVRFDNWGTSRAEMDINRVLVADKVAVRIAALTEDNKFVQEPTFEDDRRIFGAITIRPLRGTSIKANYESGSIKSSRPDPIGPINHLDQAWFDAGMPLATSEIYADAGQPRFPLGGGGTGMGNSNAVLLVYDQPGAPLPNAQFGGVGKMRMRPVRYITGADDPVGPWRFLTSGTFRGQNLGSGIRSNSPHASTRSQEQGFLDLNTYNFEQNKLMAGELNHESWKSYSVSGEQLLPRMMDLINAGVEVSYAKESYSALLDDGQWDGISNSLIVDINPYLVDGTPNPNLGRPFTFNPNPQQQLDKYSQQSWRVTAFTELDFAGARKLSWLGKHTITALLNRQESYSYHDESPYNMTPGDADPLKAAAWARNIGHIGTFQPHPAVLTYLGPSVLGAATYGDIRVRGSSTTSIPRPGETYKFNVWDRQSQQWMELSGNVIGPGRPRKANISLNKDDSVAGVLHSQWFRGDLVTTLGWRKDTVDLFAYDTVRDEFNLVKVGSTDQLTYKGTQEEKIFSYGGVVRWPSRWLRLPYGADLRVHYSKSDNFLPSPGRTDAAGRPHESPGGETEEYGFRIGLLEDRVSMKFNWYKTSLLNASTSTPLGNNEAIGEGRIYLIAENYLGAARRELDSGNAALSDQLVTIAEQFIAIAPESLANAYGFSRRDRFSINFSDPANSTQISDQESSGFEFELVATPRKGWNIGFNATQQEVLQSNIAPRFIQLYNEMLPKWQPLLDFPTSGASFAEGRPDPVRLRDSLNTLASRVEQVKRSEGLSNAEVRKWRWNVFTNYEFQRKGWLSGVGIGGALRWQDEVNIGYQSTSFTDATGANLLVADLDRPIFGPSSLQGDVWFSYKRRMWDSVNCRFQLNVRNALRDDKLVPIQGQPDSPITDVAQVRFTLPTTYILSASFEF